jgi:hypothetical protein
VVTGVWADLDTALAAHTVGGVGLRPKYRGHTWNSTVRLETTPVALGGRSAISRAIASLMRRGMLAYRPHRVGEHAFGSGYVLTATGLEAGLPHELTIADLDRRLWLLADRVRKERRNSWEIAESLPPPELAR